MALLVVFTAFCFAIPELVLGFSDPSRELAPFEFPKEEIIYRVISERYSYFKLDHEGNLEYLDDLPFQCEGAYFIPATIAVGKTAIVVMDPWIDTASVHLDAYFGEIVENWLLPLVRRAREVGHPIVILTNDPSKTIWGAHIDSRLEEMVDDEQVHLFYHQNFEEPVKFAQWLGDNNIDTLIYTGFTSNQCIIGRSTGMIPMRLQGFRCFFIPETSAAVEMADTWDSKKLHHAMTVTISQWIGNLIHWSDFMDATNAKGF